MIVAEHLARALATRSAFARATLPGTNVEIAIARLPETTRDLELALMSTVGAGENRRSADRAAMRRLIWAVVFDAESVDAGRPERFFASPAQVGELEESSIDELAGVAREHQAGAIPFSGDDADQKRDQGALDEAIATFGPLMKLRAEHAPEIVAFYGVRSALFDVTDEQVLVWWKLANMRVRGSRDEEPAAPKHRRRARRPSGS